MPRMNTTQVVLATLVFTAFATAVQAAPAAASASPANSLQALRQGFANPPAAARPMVRWWWFGAAVEKPEILRELQQMKANGIGGAELAFVYPEVLDDPSRGLVNLPFLSPPMLDDVQYAQRRAGRLACESTLPSAADGLTAAPTPRSKRPPRACAPPRLLSRQAPRPSPCPSSRRVNRSSPRPSPTLSPGPTPLRPDRPAAPMPRAHP